MFDFITTADKIDLDYEMKMVREFTPETISRISEKISNYYNNAEVHIKEIEELIRKVINEGLNTES